MTLTGYEMTQTDPLAELLTVDHVALKLRAANKPALLAELARRAAVITGLGEATLSEALAAREALGSTGFGAGIAVPHAKIDGLPAVFGFFARMEKPVAFDAIDEKPVDLVFLLLTTVVAHDAPSCASRQTIKNVLTDHARGVFQGRIEVARVAQKTDGYQMNQALLLSPTAAPGEHLAMLAAVSRRLRDKAVADSLRAADTAEAARALLVAGPVRAT